jgi:hypothetical protein
MRMKTITTAWVTLVVALAASSAGAAKVDGTVKMGGTIFSEAGDRSAVQETYNVYDGYSLTQIRLNGTLDPRQYFMLDLRDMNLDSRQGSFAYRVPGMFQLTAGYNQHRQVFDPARSVTSDRKNWKIGASLTPSRWVSVSGNFGYLTRDGDRLSYPLGTLSVLGTGYDNALKTGTVTVDAHKDRRGGAISYSLSDFSDNVNSDADRKGQVVSARLYAPMPFYDRWTHLLRASYGVRKLSNGDLEYKLSSFQYTGVLEPVTKLQLKYNFDASRVDDQSTKLKTDRFQNNVDAAYFYKYGRVDAGYGYETNDDDRSLTSYQSWRAGTVFRYQKYVTARVDYAGRNKDDLEDVTLLKDLESYQFRGKLDVRPIDRLSLGGGYAKRHREFTDIHVVSDGKVWNGSARYDYERWGSVSADYEYSEDEFTDLLAPYATDARIVTGRVEFTRIRNLHLAGGVTYLDIRKDLNIEKSMVSVEGSYRLLRDYQLEVKYNVYNYDDYILLNRYYTANVLRINVAYDLHWK